MDHKPTNSFTGVCVVLMMQAAALGLWMYLSVSCPAWLLASPTTLRLDVLKAQYDEAWQLAAGEDQEHASLRFVPRQMFIGSGT